MFLFSLLQPVTAEELRSSRHVPCPSSPSLSQSYPSVLLCKSFFKTWVGGLKMLQEQFVTRRSGKRVKPRWSWFILSSRLLKCAGADGWLTSLGGSIPGRIPITELWTASPPPLLPVKVLYSDLDSEIFLGVCSLCIWNRRHVTSILKNYIM